MIQAINAQPDSQVTAVFSTNPERANAYTAENGISKAYHAVVTVSPSSGLGCPDVTLRVFGEHFANYYA